MDWSPTQPQRELLALLRERSGEIADRLEGAFRAFAYEDNPDCLAQAALSMREVFEDLGIVLRIPQIPRGVNLGSEVNNLIVAWKGAAGLSRTTAISEAAPDRLRAESVEGLLRRVHALFVRWETQPAQRLEGHRVMFKASDPRHGFMPEDLRVQRSADFGQLDDYMNGVAHHAKTDRETFGVKLAECEELIRDLVRPAPTESRRVIDEILGGNDASG